MKKIFYDYQTFVKDCKNISKKVEYEGIDSIVAITRGGATFGHFLASLLALRNLYTISAISYDDTTKLDDIRITNIPDVSNSKKVLVVDDIIDSGDTIYKVMRILRDTYPMVEFETVALFYKEDAKFKPTYKTKIAKNWIEFFWEKI